MTEPTPDHPADSRISEPVADTRIRVVVADTRIRVVVADDHDLVRSGFRAILDAQPDLEVVGEARDGAEAVERVRETAPDVVCMDVQMPGVDGLEATRRIRGSADVGGAQPRVLILTTFDRDDYLFEALDSGASGFLLKTAGPEQLVEAVRVLARGDALLSPEVTRRVIARAADARAATAASDTEAAGASVSGTAPPLPELTEREAEVLRLVADGLSNQEIATRLYLGEATVKTHVSNVLQKLGVRDRVQAVVVAHRSGFVRG